MSRVYLGTHDFTGATVTGVGGGGVTDLQEAFDGGQSITIADGDNQTLTITNNDTTNNQNAINIVDATSGTTFDIDKTGADGVIFDIDVTNASHNDRLFDVNINIDGTLGAAIAPVAEFNDDREHTGATTVSQGGVSGMAFTQRRTVDNASATYNANSSIFRLQRIGSESAGTLNMTGAMFDILQNYSGSTGDCISIDNNGTGRSISIDHDDSGDNNPSILITRDGNDGGDIYGMKIDVDNSGAGTAGGIDLSSLAAGEPTINFPNGTASSVDPSTTAETGWINVAIGGTIRYIPYYSA